MSNYQKGTKCSADLTHEGEWDSDENTSEVKEMAGLLFDLEQFYYDLGRQRKPLVSFPDWTPAATQEEEAAFAKQSFCSQNPNAAKMFSDEKFAEAVVLLVQLCFEGYRKGMSDYERESNQEEAVGE